MLAGIVFVSLAATAAPSVAPPQPVTVRPAAVGAPHFCPEDHYPVSALQTGTEGKTVMRFTITPQGSVADISVQESSGNAELDNASLVCAQTWQYRPATQDGVAVADNWVAQVVWRISVAQPYSRLAGGARDCLRENSVAWSEMKTAPFRPVVRVKFAGGALADATMAGSTGDPDLDSLTLACYRNLPAEMMTDIPDSERLLVIMKPGE
ncbi:MAG TPA: energy transducer TonB [Rhizomicrobium sp.]|jgi:TonB family protein